MSGGVRFVRGCGQLQRPAGHTGAGALRRAHGLHGQREVPQGK